MASTGEEEVEYESDPEEAKQLLAMRRREASDDEEADDDGRENPRMGRRAVIHSDDSDSQGGVADYYDDELDGVEIEEDVYEDVEDEVVIDLGIEELKEEDDGKIYDSGVKDLEVPAKESDGDGRAGKELGENNAVDEKKEIEPFSVPTAGAFYMHDDRFRDNAVGRNRRTLGGRKLWESRDDRKWGHDKFEELTFQGRRNEEGKRSSKGNYWGRGKIRSTDRGNSRPNRSKVFNDHNNNHSNNNNHGNNNQNHLPKGVRGRGPRRYEPSNRNNSQGRTMHNKESGNPVEGSSNVTSLRGIMPMSNAEPNLVPSREHVFASSLSSASPPFYPSSSNKDSDLTQKRNVQGGSNHRNLRQSAMDESFSVPQSNPLFRGKNRADSVGLDKLYIDESVSAATGTPLTNLQMPSGSSASDIAQSTESMTQGRGLVPPGQLAYQPSSSRGQVMMPSPSQQLNVVQRGHVQTRVQPSAQSSTRQLGHCPGGGSQTSSPPRTALPITSYEPGELEPPLESSKSKNALIVNGKGTLHGSGRGSFLYNGAQVIGATGNMGGAHGDKNFSGAPAFLPVMQFGGRHPGGIGVPAVGMAFPGYVGSPQLGLGNSEMTWLPVLAGAAGAMGATGAMGAAGALGVAGALGGTYNMSPYVTVDDAYHPQPSGQTASMSSSSKEKSSDKPNNELKSSQRPEPVDDKNGQRQNKSRRYSEMNFGQ